ncbi:hypothetical protein [Moraxella lacunata]
MTCTPITATKLMMSSKVVGAILKNCVKVMIDKMVKSESESAG